MTLLHLYKFDLALESAHAKLEITYVSSEGRSDGLYYYLL
jgi:hypothetical protein